MATRRQPAGPGGSAAGLKIKLRPGAAAAKASIESQPQDSGEDVGGDSGDDSGVNEGMLKRKRASPPASIVSNKRPARGESPIPLGANGELVEVVPGKSERVAGDLHVVKQRVGQPHSSVGAVLQAEQAVQFGDRDYDEVKKSAPSLENLSHGQLLVNSVPTSDQHGTFIPGRRAGADPAGFGEKSHLMSSSMQASLPSGTPGLRTSDSTTDQHTIPSHAGWFSWTQIHTLEKRGLPEFFNGRTPGKTPKLYLEYRNAIMNKYRENVKKTLTVADVHEMFTTLDEKTISRVLEFFDHWGLINYQAPAEFRPLWQSPVAALDSDLTGMLRALPRKGFSLYEFDTLRAPVTKHGHVNQRSADVAISEMLALPEGPEVEYHCNSCGTDCSKQRYHCQKQADFDVCSDCYNDGKFGPDMVSTDFMRMDAAEEDNANAGGWTDQETLLLLEALDMYGDNWTEIAEHVATKSKAQCILHFIRLPVEDPFLEDMETPGTSLAVPAPPIVLQTENTVQGVQTGDGKADNIRESIAPITEAGAEISRDFQGPFVAFAEAPNPVMAQVAFLAAMVGPRVAAAAAQAALATLTQKDPGPRLAASTAITMEPPKGPLPSSVQQPDRLASADSEVRSASDATQPSTAGAGSVGGTSGSITPVKPNISSRPLAGSGPGGAVLPRTELNGKLYKPEEVLSSAHVKYAASSAMAAAAVKAKLLADQEEREMQRLVTIVIEHQLKKLELKLKTFHDLETMLSKECESVERARQKIYSEHARMVATRLGTSSSPNPPGALGAGQQAGAAGQRPAGYTFGPGGQSTPLHTPGAASSFQGINPSGIAQSPGLQGLARPVTAGAMSTPQGQFMRQGMVGGATPQSVGRTAMPQGTGMATPTLQQPLGRPSMPIANTPGQTPGRPLTAPPGMSRPAPGATSSGTPQ
ncbi:hypothetical protein M758_2G180500 [Ceratodon purpureus]|nr:hypothetical protein M758_2G180500 [Ceratodon purpureus]